MVHGVTDTPDPATPESSQTSATRPPALNATALFDAAATKSSVLWVEDGEGRAWPVWYAWAEDTVWVVSGAGEQTLPWLPERVRLVLRSKDSGGRLLTVRASVTEVTSEDPQWEQAVAALVPVRLNGRGDLATRWREQCTIRALRPFGAPEEAPGRYDDASGRAPVRPTPATTTTRRPWHLRGRPVRRRRLR